MSAIHLRGDWRKLNHIARKLGDTSDYCKNELIQELAEDVKQTLYEVVNSSPNPRNTDSTVRRKGFNNPMFETGGFQEGDSIVATPYREGRKVSYCVQGNPNKIHDRTGESYDDIVSINSEGGENTPSRDLLEIAYDLKRDDIRNKCIVRVREHWR